LILKLTLIIQQLLVWWIHL